MRKREFDRQEKANLERIGPGCQAWVRPKAGRLWEVGSHHTGRGRKRGEWAQKGKGVRVGTTETSGTSEFGLRTFLQGTSVISRSHLLSTVSAQFYVLCCTIYIRMTWSWSLINLKSRAILHINILQTSHFTQREENQESRQSNLKGTKPLPL